MAFTSGPHAINVSFVPHVSLRSREGAEDGALEEDDEFPRAGTCTGHGGTKEGSTHSTPVELTTMTRA